METITATAARSSLFSLIKQTTKAHKEFRITSKEGNSVLLSEEDYEGLIETLELMSQPGFMEAFKEAKEDIKAGRVYTMDEVFGDK